MIKAYSAIIFLFLLILSGFSFAQSENDWASKIYSGYLHQEGFKSKASFWHTFFAKRPANQEKDVPVRQCSIEFKSPISFTYQPVTQVPEELSYFIRFNDDASSGQGKTIKGKCAFEKFVIKIYTSDEQEYEIDPDAQGQQVGINDEHHIFDSYLIYLILSQNIDHLEIVSSSGKDKGKYVLDKLEIRDDD